MYDIKYIETLLDKYWDAQTSEEEELLLNEYFSKQVVLPQSLQYALPFFSAKNEHKAAANLAHRKVLNDAFDTQILTAITKDENTNHPKIKNWKYGVTSIAAILVVSVGLILWHNQQKMVAIKNIKQSTTTTNIPLVKRNNVVLANSTKTVINSRNKVSTKQTVSAASLSNKYNFKQLNAPMIAKKTIEHYSEIKDTYKNPEDAKKCLDSVLAVVSQKYNQGFDVIVEQTADLELLENPFKKIKNQNKDEERN